MQELNNQVLTETDIDALRNMGMTLININRFSDAIPVFEDIVKYSEDKNIIGVAHSYIAYCYFRTAEIDKAISEYEKAREYFDELPISDKISLLASLAHMYELTNQKEKSLEVLKELSELDPDNQDNKKKIENLEREINGKDLLNDNKFNSIEEAFIQKNIYLQRGEYEKANEVLDFIIEIQPEQPIPWIDKGYAYYYLGNYEEAMKNLDKALEYFDTASEYNPNRAYALSYKSLVYIEWEDFENAEDIIVKALNILPDNAGFLNIYSNCLTNLGKHEEAIDIADKALSIDSDYFDAYVSKAFALNSLNRFDEAIECYKKALEMSPNNIDILKGITLSYIKMGDMDNARKYNNKARKIEDPEANLDESTMILDTSNGSIGDIYFL